MWHIGRDPGAPDVPAPIRLARCRVYGELRYLRQGADPGVIRIARSVKIIAWYDNYVFNLSRYYRRV